MTSDTLSLITIGTSTISLFLNLLTNFLSGSGSGGDLFVASVSETSDKHQTYITPAGWAFIIWTPIFFLLAASQLYIIIAYFVKKSGDRMLFDPHVITPTFLIITTINFACNTSWVFIADRSYEKSWLVGLASFFLFLVAISNIVATGVLARNIAFYTDQLTTFKAIVYRIILNTYAMYTTWSTIASLINLAQAIAYCPISQSLVDGHWMVDSDDEEKWLDLMKTSAYLSLSLLVVFHVTWFIVENFLADRTCRWILVPYCVVIWAASAAYDKKKDNEMVPEGIKDYLLAIIIIACITLVARIALIIFRSFRK